MRHSYRHKTVLLRGVMEVSPKALYETNLVAACPSLAPVLHRARYYSAESLGAMMVNTTHHVPQMMRVATGLQKAIPTATT
jgi:hypothetical protein